MADTSSVPSRVAASTAEVPRARVLMYVEKVCPRATLVCAPSGYGKTVLAAQIAELPRFDRCAWVGCEGHVLHGDALLSKAAGAIREVCLSESEVSAYESASLPDAADSMVELDGILKSEHRPVCVVLDDLCLGAALPEVSELVALFSRLSGGHALIITTREEPGIGMASLRGILSIDVNDMRFDKREAEELISRVVGTCDLEGLSSDALDVSGGQAALVSVLARHYAIRGDSGNGGKTSLDLKALLVRLAETQLDRVHSEVLVALSVLGHATPAELESVSQSFSCSDLYHLSERIPLIRLVPSGATWIESAHVHDLASEVFSSQEYSEGLGRERLSEIYSACTDVLELRRDYRRLVPFQIGRLGPDELAQWLVISGERVAQCGQGSELGRALDVLPTTLLLSHARLLLMSAEYGRVASDANERMDRASAARGLAQCEGDMATVADALLVKANAAKDLGRPALACDVLSELLELPDGTVSRERRLLSTAHLATLLSVLFQGERASELSGLLAQAMASESLREPTAARIATQLACVEYFSGRTRQAMLMLAQACDYVETPLVLKAMTLSNLAIALHEMGQTSRAAEIAEQQLAVSEGHGLESYRASGDCARALLRYVLSSEAVGVEWLNQSIDAMRGFGDRASEAATRLQRATILRTLGDFDGAMADVEAALEYAANNGIAYHQYLAEAELAANFLALGDLDAAARHAQRVRQACTPGNALHQILRADMVLSEVGRRQGRIEESVDRLLAHEEYVLEDNMNYIIAMYIRSFPALLGLFASALGAQRLPGYMLRMISGTHAEDALLASRDLVSADEWKTLASRLLGKDGPERLELLATVPTCRVRMFGGLEVTIGDREIPEADWRKRKARLLFAMLVLQHGRDLSRESIYEYLWPEMTEAKARNNLYVTWSAMKAALMPDSERNTPCPYVNHKGGVCRISTALVSSDVARFDTLFTEARSAESAGNHVEALRAYEGLVDVYRGELLPGDIYDDWFASTRDRYRQDFGDSMLAAHRLLCEQGDHASALRMVRRGIAVDSWREDLYQAALKSQIVLGQRGAAVATYMTCRSCLAEDLGLDPSNETVRLYEQVLAMEDGPDPGFTA